MSRFSSEIYTTYTGMSNFEAYVPLYLQILITLIPSASLRWKLLKFQPTFFKHIRIFNFLRCAMQPIWHKRSDYLANDFFNSFHLGKFVFMLYLWDFIKGQRLLRQKKMLVILLQRKEFIATLNFYQPNESILNIRLSYAREIVKQSSRFKVRNKKKILRV
jgi:hypothetical protein